MSQSSLSTIVRDLRKARMACAELEDDLLAHLEENFALNEDITEIAEVVIENIDKFEDAGTVENVLIALGGKTASKSHRRGHSGKKTKEEVIQSVKERRAAQAEPEA